ncbi:class GN sortase [Shewanella inventionis]|uniref:class GN sortase n=1 Tax=Shewanella inventionis TaxID=1738770 RepID=UPI001CBC1247|nr:class GN sortase [Shewanella inventionis]UAL42196.1 class GN sortase [Shewanella inventionis]
MKPSVYTTTHLWIMALIILLGLGLIVQGGYMQAKAHFAQFLIERAFEQTLVDNQPHKPWSWADTHPVAKMRLLQTHAQGTQALGPDLYVLAGASGRNLAFGPSLMLGGAGVGEQGNTIIAGHRDSHFMRLQYVNVGDMIELYSATGKLQVYQITATQVVHETATEVLNQTENSQLTLITCYPFDQLSGNAQYRYIVQAKPMV